MSNWVAPIRQPAKGLVTVTFDGAYGPIAGIVHLSILREIMGRYASDHNRNIDDVRPNEIFDFYGGTGIGGFLAILFALNLSVSEASRCLEIILKDVVLSEGWTSGAYRENGDALDAALEKVKTEIGLQERFENSSGAKGFTAASDVASAGLPRLLRTYKPRANAYPESTIEQMLRVSLADGIHLPDVTIETSFVKQQFRNAMEGHNNSTELLMKELQNAYSKETAICCMLNIGAGHVGAVSLADDSSIQKMLRSCELVGDRVSAQCSSLPGFFLRLSPSQGLQNLSMDGLIDPSQVMTHTTSYCSEAKCSASIDDFLHIAQERHPTITAERLYSLAGSDGQTKIQRDLNYIRTTLDIDDQRKLFDWLKPLEQTYVMDDLLRDRAKGTCEWLFHDLGFKHWLAGKKRFLWYHGLMGSGKSMTSSVVTQWLRDPAHNQSGSAAVYYFMNSDAGTHPVASLLRSLLSQLLDVDSGYFQALYRDHSSGSRSLSYPTLVAALKNISSTQACSAPVFCIIDALDECPTDKRRYLFSFLTEIASWPDSALRIMLTSRDDYDIRRELPAIDPIDIIVPSNTIDKDIATYVGLELGQPKWLKWPERQKQQIRATMTNKANGMFRLVVCHFDILRSAHTPGELQRALELLPPTLQGTYDFILMHIIPEGRRTQCHRLLQILRFAHKLVDLDELADLLAVEDDGENLAVYRPDERFFDPQELFVLGSSLVTAATTIFSMPSMRLAHASVMEYLATPSLGCCYSLDRSVDEEVIARCCLAVIKYKSRNLDQHFPYCYCHRYIDHKNPSDLLIKQAYDLLCDQHDHIICSRFTKFTMKGSLHESWCNGLSTALYWDWNKLVRLCLERGGFSQLGLDDALRVFAGHVSLQNTRLLVEHGADPHDCFALKAAASNERLETVKFLVEEGANVNDYCGGLYGHALQAAAHGSLDIVEFLTKEGADVNASGGEYGNALQAAAYHGSLEIVEFLVKEGADVNASGGWYGNALQAAAYHGSLEVVEFLTKEGADINASGGEYGNALQAAAYHGSLEIVEFLTTEGADVNASGGEYGNALQAAAYHGSLEIVEFLVKEGANVNASGGLYGSALQAACLRGNIEIAEYLLKNGAEVGLGVESVTDDWSYGVGPIRSPLEAAIVNKNEWWFKPDWICDKLVALLEKYGAVENVAPTGKRVRHGSASPEPEKKRRRVEAKEDCK